MELLLGRGARADAVDSRGRAAAWYATAAGAAMRPADASRLFGAEPAGGGSVH